MFDYIQETGSGATSGWGPPRIQFSRPPENLRASVDAYYFRMKVENSGNLRAENAEIIAEELQVMDDSGAYKKVDWFLPTNLLWTHIEKPFVEAISPKTAKLCNLGFIIKPSQRDRVDEIYDREDYGEQALLNLELEVLSNHKGHIIPPGKYKLKLKVAAANTKPSSVELQIKFNGEWDDTDEEMFQRNIEIRKL